jgi:hypothetical protein
LGTPVETLKRSKPKDLGPIKTERQEIGLGPLNANGCLMIEIPTVCNGCYQLLPVALDSQLDKQRTRWQKLGRAIIASFSHIDSPTVANLPVSGRVLEGIENPTKHSIFGRAGKKFQKTLCIPNLHQLKTLGLRLLLEVWCTRFVNRKSMTKKSRLKKGQPQRTRQELTHSPLSFSDQLQARGI